MIANARMYSVSDEAGALWRQLLAVIFEAAAVPVSLIDHAAPAPLEELWQRPDKGAVFMCGLPFARSLPQPQFIVAPVPSPAEFDDRPVYWSEFVVRIESRTERLEDTFGQRLALTDPESQSGCVAALSYFMEADLTSANGGKPLFSEIVAPTVTPLGSLRAVVHGTADLAPIDSYAFRLLQRYRSDLTAQVRIVSATVPTPIPPLVASYPGLKAVQEAFLSAHENPASEALMEKLLLKRFAKPPPSDYATLQSRAEAAIRYWCTHPLAAVTHPAFSRCR